MKSFLISIPQRLRLKSQELDAQAVLCNRSWTVFNDECTKQLFIFQPDGSLLIATDGVVANSSWRYLPVNNSIIITSGEKSIMLHPAFVDNTVFALEQDGGAGLYFMIDEKSQSSFSPKTLTDLRLYFQRKEQALIEKEQKEREDRERHRKEQDIRIREEQRKQELEEEQKRVREQEEKRIRLEAKDLEESLLPHFWEKPVIIASCLALILLVIIVSSWWFDEIGWFNCVLLVAMGWGSFYVLSLLVLQGIYNARSDKWKNKHPDDPRNKYLT